MDEQLKKRARSDETTKKSPFVGITDDLLQKLADFIVRNTQNTANYEIEGKLGIFIDKKTKRRLYLPVSSETLLMPDNFYRFESNMTMEQHRFFNQILNGHVQSNSLKYLHSKVTDKVYRVGNRKVRVSVDPKTGQILKGKTIEKTKVADFNVIRPNHELDFRISINIETPCEEPPKDCPLDTSRYKDRLSYSDDDIQIDLTQLHACNKPLECFEVCKFTLIKRYDNDVTTWSPQGRIHQLEYAVESVKQGAAAVGLRSSTHTVLLTRSQHELASYQKKIMKIDNHVGLAMSGLSSDARVLGNFLRMQARKSRMIYNRPIPVGRLVGTLSDKAQVNTQRYGSRPYGVGLLVAGFDETGPHLYEFGPTGNYYEYYAVSIGARSQSAKTYFEKYYESFENASLQDLILHGMRALRDTLQQDKELTIDNLSIAIVGKDHKFEVVEDEACKKFLDALAADPGQTRAKKQDDVQMQEASSTPMETE